MRTASSISCVIALLGLVPGGPARADDKASPVERELAELAEDVVKVLAMHDQTSVRVGGFSCKGAVKSNFGPEIQRILMEELSRRKIAVDPKAMMEVSGDYRPADKNPDNPDLKAVFLRINAQIVNTKTGRPIDGLADFSRAVYGNATVARALGVTSRFSPAVGFKEANDSLQQQIDHPDCHIDGGKVSSHPGSPFVVEVLVVDKPDAPDPAAGRDGHKEDGLAFVAIRRGEVYRVKITNNAPFDVAASLQIDGLDQFVFSNPSMTLEQDGQTKTIPMRDPKTGKPRYNYRIIPQGGSTVIAGWFRDLKTADSFVVSEYAKSAAAELTAAPADLGQIVVQFHACWEKEEDRPKDEGSRGADGTGRGPEVRQNLIEVHRTIGGLRDTVAVRYEKKGL